MTTSAAVIALVATVGIGTVVLVAMIANHHLLVKLRRADRKTRLLHLWARERRADLAHLVSLFIQTWDDETITKLTAFERLDVFESELQKQARYVGLAWTQAPRAAPGFTEPEKLSPTELIELLDLSHEYGGLS